MENTEIYTNITIREERNKMKKFTVCLLIGAMAASMLTGWGGEGGGAGRCPTRGVGMQWWKF